MSTRNVFQSPASLQGRSADDLFPFTSVAARLELAQRLVALSFAMFDSLQKSIIEFILIILKS